MDEDEMRELATKIVEVGTEMDTFASRLHTLEVHDQARDIELNVLAKRIDSLEAFANKASDDLTFLMQTMLDVSAALADVINRLDALENPEEDQNEH